MGNKNKAILVVSFGTSHNDTREKTIDVIERIIQAIFPDYEVYRAWTSKMIIEKVKERDRVINHTVPQAIEGMLKDGITELIVQPTHILNGVENDLMIQDIMEVQHKFQSVRFGTPLLSSTQDCLTVIQAVMEEWKDLKKEEALIFMGHGTTHYANSQYAALDYMFKDLGYSNVFVGTVEAYPSLTSIMKHMKQQAPTCIYLAPFMIVAGDHAKHDMASSNADSWYAQLLAQGYTVSCKLKGLGEYRGIQDVFIKHIQGVLVKN